MELELQRSFNLVLLHFFSLMNAKTAITMQHVGALFKTPVRFRDCSQQPVLGQTRKCSLTCD